MITVVMAAVVDPVAAVPTWSSGIICIWIPGIRIVVNVRAPIVSVWIII